MYTIGRKIMRNEEQARKLANKLRDMNLDDEVIIVSGTKVHYEYNDETGRTEDWIERLAWSIYNGK